MSEHDRFIDKATETQYSAGCRFGPCLDRRLFHFMFPI